MRGLRTFAAVALAALPAAAQASETIIYTYDAKGRLVKVVHSGTANNNVQVEYTHDKADNRTNVKTTGASNRTPDEPALRRAFFHLGLYASSANA